MNIINVPVTITIFEFLFYILNGIVSVYTRLKKLNWYKVFIFSIADF